MKRFSCVVLALLICCTCFVFAGCEDNTPNPTLTLNFGGGLSGIEGEVVIELFKKEAPNTVRNIIYLTEQGFYDNMKVNMAVENSFIEIADGGGLKTLADTKKAPDYAIKFEENDLQFDEGIVAMSRYDKNDKDTATDGFFITLGKFPEAQGEFTIFGKVIKGMEVIREIAASKTTDASLHFEPIYPVKIATATVQKMGGRFAPPETIKREYYVWNSYNPWWTGRTE